MAVQRIFYVTQQKLIVYLHRHGAFEQGTCFDRSEDGCRDFFSYLEGASQQQSLMVVDVIEEEFTVDSIPKLGLRDRKALIERRLLRKFPRTPYRLGHFQRSKKRKDNNHEVMYSAVSNQELLDPWLRAIRMQRVPLHGIHSVPLSGAELLGKLFKADGKALLMTLHQGNMLRQVFVCDGKLKSARLSKSPNISATTFGDFIFAEVLRSRRYLERNRLLDSFENIDVYLVADQKAAERIQAADPGTTLLKIHFIDPATAAKSVGLQDLVECDHLEFLYLALLARSQSHSCYALQAETQYFQLQKVRHAFVGGALVASIACSIIAGINFVDGIYLQSASAATEKQNRQITDSLQRENENLSPVRANSHEMKLAVDTGDYILQNRLPVAWVMQEISVVLEQFPQVQINELNWRALPVNDESEKRSRRRVGDKPLPVRIPELTTISVEIAAQIRPFGGDMRDAFATIERLVVSLQENTAFNHVVTTDYPLDADPQSSVSGEVTRDGKVRSADFRLRLDLNRAKAESANENG